MTNITTTTKTLKDVIEMKGIRDTIDLQIIYNSLNDNEKFGLSFGLFPISLMPLNLDNSESAELIRISQNESEVEY